MKSLVEFYPKHIEKGDRHFILPIMIYFSKEEKEAMLNEEYKLDRMLIHEIYRDYIGKNEEKPRNTFADKRDQQLNSAADNKC